MALPLNQNGAGGIAIRTSSRSITAIASTSAASWAAIARRTSSISASVGRCGGAPVRPWGRFAAIVARARWRALLTATTDMSSSSAVSFADQSTTSRRIRTARWRGGNSWTAARNASSIVSRWTATVSGSSSGGAISSRSRSGYGPIQGTSPIESSDRPAGRRLARRIASRQTFVAIRYSHARRAAEPSKDSRPRHARRYVSWTASSASSKLPSIRYEWTWSSRR